MGIIAPQHGQCNGIPSYEIDTSIQLNGVFENVALGVPADPTTITLYVQDPTGATDVIGAPAITRSDVGLYSYAFVPSVSGIWVYKWQGVGTVVATTPDTMFIVNSSFVIAG